MFDDDETNDLGPAQNGSNCPDDVKRDFYRQALIAKISADDAQATFKKKNDIYRNVLKQAEKAGVAAAAITNVLEKRMQDPDLVLIEERERLKMYDLSGYLPGIKDKLLDRLDVAEPTTKEAAQLALIDARDKGALAGRLGLPLDRCEHLPGTELHVAWLDGHRTGQRAIADEMDPNNPDNVVSLVTPEKRPRGRPRKLPMQVTPAESAPAEEGVVLDEEYADIPA